MQIVAIRWWFVMVCNRSCCVYACRFGCSGNLQFRFRLWVKFGEKRLLSRQYWNSQVYLFDLVHQGLNTKWVFLNFWWFSMTPFIQDGKLAPYMTRPSPPSFGQGFTSKCFGLFFKMWCTANDCMCDQILFSLIFYFCASFLRWSAENTVRRLASGDPEASPDAAEVSWGADRGSQEVKEGLVS